MPRCGCAGSSCTCLVTGGEGITVEGAGTADNPYVIDIEAPDIGGTIQFVDTPTIDFTVTGQGTEAAPYQVTATLIGSLGDLSNVDCDIAEPGQTLVSDGERWQCGLPVMALDDLADVDVADANGNEVLTYNATTGQWEPGVVSVEPGQVNTAHGASGDGTASTPVIVQTAAEFDAGELEGLSGGGQAQDDGIPVYIDTLGNVRTPRGLYLYMNAANTMPAGPSAAPFWNPGAVATGDRTSAVVRGFLAEKLALGDDGGFASRTHMYASDYFGIAAGAMQVRNYAAGADPADPADWSRESTWVLRADGQVTIRTLDAAGAGSWRPRPFAFAQGTTTLEGAANAVRRRVITFPAGRFTSIPRTFLQSNTGTTSAGTTNTESWVSLSSPTSCQINVNRSNSTDVAMWWMSVQEDLQEVHPALQGPRSPVHQVGELPVDDGLATCGTPGCDNQGFPIPVPMSWVDEDGVEHPNTDFECGVCGLPITNIEEIS